MNILHFKVQARRPRINEMLFTTLATISVISPELDTHLLDASHLINDTRETDDALGDLFISYHRRVKLIIATPWNMPFMGNSYADYYTIEVEQSAQCCQDSITRPALRPM